MGPSGSAVLAAAVSAARNGFKVVLLERYHHMGGMVLVLDDMVTDGTEIVTTGIVWCNCQHVPGFDGLTPEDMVAAEYEGRVARLHDQDLWRKPLPPFLPLDAVQAQGLEEALAAL